MPMWPRSCMSRDLAEKTKDYEEGGPTRDGRRPNGEKLLYIARIAYVFIFVVFFVIYWTVVLVNKSSLEKKGLSFYE